MSKFVTKPVPAAAKTVVRGKATQTDRIHVKANGKTVVDETRVDETEASSETLFERMRDAAESYFNSIQAPSWTRRVVSITLGILTYGTVFYGCMQLIDILCLAVVAYTGLGFISFMAAFLGILVAIIAATTAGKWVYDTAMVFEYSTFKAKCASFFRIGAAKPAVA